MLILPDKSVSPSKNCTEGAVVSVFASVVISVASELSVSGSVATVTVVVSAGSVVAVVTASEGSVISVKTLFDSYVANLIKDAEDNSKIDESKLNLLA